MSDESHPPLEHVGKRRLRLVGAEEVPEHELDERPFYDHVEGSGELRAALERVQGLLRGESLIASAERARVNACVVVDDLLFAMEGGLHGKSTHEASARIDRVSEACSQFEPDTLVTTALLQAIIDESRRFDGSGAMPDYSTTCPKSLEDFMARWPERWLKLKLSTFVEAARAWAKAKAGRSPAVWKPVLAALIEVGIPATSTATLRRARSRWEAAGLIRG